MSNDDGHSIHFSALNWAHKTYRAICDDGATFHITDGKGDIHDVTAEIREHHHYIIKVLERVTIEDRRRNPRG